MLKRLTVCVTVCFLSALTTCFAQSLTRSDEATTLSLEDLINRCIGSYALSPDNQFKLAAYAELKGTYHQQSQALVLPFGIMGELSFFPKNLLYRTAGHGVYHLNKYEMKESLSEAINGELNRMFEQVMLLGNHEASLEHISFVDKSLARKNLEPFEKLYVRHMLIKYGRYDDVRREVTFHSNWLPKRTYDYRSPKDKRLVKKSITPLAIKLSDKTLRGYYLISGGTVYIENVERNIAFATGEASDPNVTAFKLFAQKLFVQTVQYIAKMESQRIEALPERQLLGFNPLDPASAAPLANSERVVSENQSAQSAPMTKTIRPLYHEYSWIPMMLSILRANEVNIGEEEVICYFVDQSYFSRIYAQLKTEEKEKVDQYLAARSTTNI